MYHGGMKQPKIMVFFLLVVISASSFAENRGFIFKVDTPPLGFPDYVAAAESARRHRLTVSWLRYSTDFSEMNGAAASMTSFLHRRSNGAVSLKYGGFFVTGTESDAIMTEVSPGVWVSDGDSDLTVWGPDIQLQLEGVLLASGPDRVRRHSLLGFIAASGHYQRISQRFSFDPKQDSDTDVFACGLQSGLQGNIAIGYGFAISPFAQASVLAAFGADTDPGFMFTGSAGLDVRWRSFSLGALVQPMMDASPMTTISLGFVF